MSSWKDALILEKDETIIGSWEGGYEWHDKAESGIFVLTNRMIIFLKQEGGFFKKEMTHNPLFTIPLEEVNSVSRGETYNKSVSVFLANDNKAIFYFSRIDESALNQLMGLVRKQVSARKEQMAITGATQDDSFKKEIIREKEVIVKVRCPYCKNTYEETLDKCPHCGGHA